MAGQSIGDRFTAAQHTIIGSDMSKSVCKASTHEVMGPKKKHLDYLTALTREQNVNIPELADLLIERTKVGSWVVVFKGLSTVHHLMYYGNERFIQHLASRHTLFNLSDFIDKTGVQGYDMSTFVRRYSRYLNQKAVSYRTVAYDFTRVKRGKDSGVLRGLPVEKLLKTLPTLCTQLDVLLEFQASANELTNGVVNNAFMLLFKDVIRLFACYNDGIINLLEKYFEMKKLQCKEALDLYKKFLTRMDKVAEFMKVAEQVGIDKGDIPDLTQAPNSLLDALEQHYANLDGKKVQTTTKPSSTTSAQVQAFSAVGSSFDKIDMKDKEATLLEEENRMKMFKMQAAEQKAKVKAPMENSAVAAPADNQQTSSASVDLFATGPVTTSSNSANLFDIFSAPPSTVQSTPQMNTQPFGVQPMQQPFVASSTAMNNQPFMGGMNHQQPFNPAEPSSQSNFFPSNSSLFDSNNSVPFQSDVLMPTVFGQPQTQATVGLPVQNTVAPVTGSLDMSLANVMADLTTGAKANQNFQPRMEKKLTGGMNFQPQMNNSTTMPMTMQMPGAAPGMMPPMMGTPMYNPQMQMGMQPMAQPNMYGQQPMIMRPQMNPNNMQQLNPNNPFGPMINF